MKTASESQIARSGVFQSWIMKEGKRNGGLTRAEHIEREAFIEAKRKQYCADCDRRKGMKNGKMRFCYEIGEAPCRACYVDDLLTDVPCIGGKCKTPDKTCYQCVLDWLKQEVERDG